jgi:lysophospholipase L1-like esterase
LGFGASCCGGDEDEDEEESPRPGWASLLSFAYSRRADVLNRGYSGYNTDHYLEILPRILGKGTTLSSAGSSSAAALSAWDARGTVGTVDILFCTVFLGANDAALPGEPQHVPIDRYRRNLQAIVRSIRQATSSTGAAADSGMDESARERAFPIIVCTPPPVDEAAWCRFRAVDRSDRTNKRTRSYGNCAKQVAAMTPNCACLDVWELLEGHDPDKLSAYLSDGLHLNHSGNRRLYDGLMKLIVDQFPDLAPMVDGEGRYGASGGGVPLEEELWKVRCGVPLSNSEPHGAKPTE